MPLNGEKVLLVILGLTIVSVASGEWEKKEFFFKGLNDTDALEEMMGFLRGIFSNCSTPSIDSTKPTSAEETTELKGALDQTTTVTLPEAPGIDTTSARRQSNVTIEITTSKALRGNELTATTATLPDVQPPIPTSTRHDSDITTKITTSKAVPGSDLTTSTALPDDNFSTATTQECHPRANTKPSKVNHPTIAPLPKSCKDVTLDDAKFRNDTGGVFDINIPGVGVTEVYCDTKTDCGDWTVFQRRMDGSVDFDRNWTDYVNGFGNVRGEFWLGLEIIHQLTKKGKSELRIDMIERKTYYYAKYSDFKVSNACAKYKLHVKEYTGNTTLDTLSWTHNNQFFSTRDRENDKVNWGNCAEIWKGGWWYGGSGCHASNLNGPFNELTGQNGIAWKENAMSHEYMHMRFTEMKMRRLG